MTVDHEHQHRNEPHRGSLANRLNWLRAGVLGANDGIVSTAGIVVGVAAATADRGAIFTAGVAGLAAGRGVRRVTHSESSGRAVRT